MLERQALWLGPWSPDRESSSRPAADAGRPLSVFLEPATQEFLGIVREQTWRVPFWFGYLDRVGLAVYETEDESLLFTVERSWGLGATAWQVRDADGHRVGTLRGELARDPAGSRLAVLEKALDGSLQRWLAPQGQELGTATPSNSGLLIHFGPDTDGHPFVRMVLLAMLLRLE